MPEPGRNAFGTQLSPEGQASPGGIRRMNTGEDIPPRANVLAEVDRGLTAREKLAQLMNRKVLGMVVGDVAIGAVGGAAARMALDMVLGIAGGPLAGGVMGGIKGGVGEWFKQSREIAASGDRLSFKENLKRHNGGRIALAAGRGAIIGAAGGALGGYIIEQVSQTEWGQQAGKFIVDRAGEFARTTSTQNAIQRLGAFAKETLPFFKGAPSSSGLPSVEATATATVPIISADEAARIALGEPPAAETPAPAEVPTEYPQMDLPERDIYDVAQAPAQPPAPAPAATAPVPAAPSPEVGTPLPPLPAAPGEVLLPPQPPVAPAAPLSPDIVQAPTAEPPTAAAPPEPPPAAAPEIQTNQVADIEPPPSISEKIASLQNTIFLENGSNPWATTSQYLEQALSREPTPAEIMEVTKAVCRTSGINVPEWGIQGQFLHTRLPVGFQLNFDDSVKGVIEKIANK